MLNKKEDFKMNENQKKEGSYWDGNGLYQEEYDKLYTELVPDRGMANTLHGQLILSVNRLGWDYWNNGYCNAMVPVFETDTYYNNDEEGYIEEDEYIDHYEWDDFYKENFVDFLIKNGSEEVQEVMEKLYTEVMELMETDMVQDLDFSYKEDSKVEVLHNRLISVVMEQVLSTENRELTED